MREAMRMVREEQGPDAVILSSRRLPNGVEVVAATDYDAALMHQVTRKPQDDPSAAPEAEPDRASVTAITAADTSPARMILDTNPPTERVLSAAGAEASELSELRREMGGVRRLLQQQLASFAWQDMKTRNPVKLSVLRALSGLGLEADLARQIAGELPANTSYEVARSLPLHLLAQCVPVVQQEPIADGGVFALLGPTGVGKTTTIAKLAARYARIHGLRDIALITTDHYRIGAQEQLHSYGRLLGVPVASAATGSELAAALDKFKDRKLVLIDTAGMSQRDRHLAEQFATLSAVPHPIRSYLVLSSTCQAIDLDEIVQRYSAARPQGCILTKLDEATRIGGALSIAVKHALPLAYVTDGQRVPEDLQTANAQALVDRAIQLAKQTPSSLDDDILAMQFTSASAHAHV